LTRRPYPTYHVKNRFRTQVLKEKAEQLVREGMAVNLDTNTIQYLYDDKSLREYVLERDRYQCNLCGGYAQYVERIVSKKDGGLRTPANSRSVCLECNQYSKLLMETTLNNGLPLYLNNHMGFTISNPTEDIVRSVCKQNEIHCYCDISKHPNANIFGIAVVMVGGNKKEGVYIHTRTITNPNGNPTWVELKARCIGLASLGLMDSHKITIYTDTEISRMKSPMSELNKVVEEKRQYPSVEIVYLDPDAQEHPLYKTAHEFARGVAQSKNNKLEINRVDKLLKSPWL